MQYFQQPSYVEYLREHCSPQLEETRGRVVGLQLARQVLDRLGLKPGQRVLEVGCGLGRILHLLETEYGVEVFGCDISESVVAEAQRLLPHAAGRITVSPSDDVAHRGQHFDHVVLWGVFEMTAQRQTLVEISRLLRVGGQALLCSVKPARYAPDDEDSEAARRAYIEKRIPIRYTDIEAFERLASFLGFTVRERMVFEYKRDLTSERYTVETAPRTDMAASDVFYVLEKTTHTPLDAQVQISPEDVGTEAGTR